MLADGSLGQAPIAGFHEKWNRVAARATREQGPETHFSCSEWVVLDEEHFAQAKRVPSEALDTIHAFSLKSAKRVRNLVVLGLGFLTLVRTSCPLA